MSGYDHFRTLAQVQKAYRRCRTVKYFVIEAGAKWNPPCKCCSRKVFDFSGDDTDGQPMHPKGFDGNRCTYNPRTKTVTAMHYTCAWGKTLDEIVHLRRAG
jgi:hypothetical protein